MRALGHIATTLVWSQMIRAVLVPLEVQLPSWTPMWIRTDPSVSVSRFGFVGSSLVIWGYPVATDPDKTVRVWANGTLLQLDPNAVAGTSCVADGTPPVNEVYTHLFPAISVPSNQGFLNISWRLECGYYTSRLDATFLLQTDGSQGNEVNVLEINSVDDKGTIHPAIEAPDAVVEVNNYNLTPGSFLLTLNSQLSLQIPIGTSLIQLKGLVGPSQGSFRISFEPVVQIFDQSSWVFQANWYYPYEAELFMAALDPKQHYRLNVQGLNNHTSISSVKFWSNSSSQTLAIAGAATTASSQFISSSTSSRPSSSSSGTISVKSSKSNVGAIVGGVIGGLAVLIGIGVLIWFCVVKRKRSRSDNEEYTTPVFEVDPAWPEERETTGNHISPYTRVSFTDTVSIPANPASLTGTGTSSQHRSNSGSDSKGVAPNHQDRGSHDHSQDTDAGPLPLVPPVYDAQWLVPGGGATR